MDINTFIAEATKVAEPVQASQEAKVETTPETQEAPKEQPTDAKEAPESSSLQNKADHELTQEQLAKRESNRIAHLRSEAAKRKRENIRLKQEIEQLKQGAKPQTQEVKQNNEGRPVKPKPESFRTWGEYEDARDVYDEQFANWALERKLSERDTKALKENQAQQADQYKLARAGEATKSIDAVAKQNPDYATLVNQHADFLNNIPPHIDDAFLAAENPGLALYALMKEGNLEALEDMPPERVLMEIGKAELRGERYLNRNKVTNAPTPMTPAKGNSSTNKPVTGKQALAMLKT